MLELRSRFSRNIAQLAATIGIIPFIFPLVAMVRGALSGEGWMNFAKVMQVPAFPLFFRNSAIIVAFVVAFTYIIALMAAFGFSKLNIRRREVYFWMILVCFTVPDVVLLPPLFQMATQLGMFNTYWAVIIPMVALHVPFGALLARNFLDGVPSELFEAARIDGANTRQVFIHLVIPLTKPIAAAVVIFTLLAAWNSYLLPLVFLQSPETQTVTQIPAFFVSEFNTDHTKVMAASCLTAIPSIVAYLCLQNLFERGMSAGAIK
jgi:multiple sugar transport system permease protein/raffinose/stachyose/melibiose transport system permease protein